MGLFMKGHGNYVSFVYLVLYIIYYLIENVNTKIYKTNHSKVTGYEWKSLAGRWKEREKFESNTHKNRHSNVNTNKVKVNILI